MRSKASFVLLLTLISFSSAADYGIKCFNFIQKAGLFNFQKVCESEGLVVDVQNLPTTKIQFNLCNDFTPSSKNCQTAWNSFGYLLTADSCKPLAYGKDFNTNNKKTIWSYTAIPNNGGIEILGRNDQTEKTLHKNLKVKLLCNRNAGAHQNVKASYNTDQDLLEIDIESAFACIFDFEGIWSKLGWVQYLLQVLVIIAALVICLFGVRIYKIAIGIIGFLVGGAGGYLLLSLFIPIEEQRDTKLWVVIGVSFAIAVVCCILLILVEKLGLIAGGAALGYVLGTLLYDLFIHYLDKSDIPYWYYVTVITFAIGFGVLAIFLHDHVIILACAIVGGYGCIRMIGTMIGNYPAEDTIAARIKAGQYEGMPWQVYLYLSLAVVLSITGVVVQCILKKKMDEKVDVEVELVSA